MGKKTDALIDDLSKKLKAVQVVSDEIRGACVRFNFKHNEEADPTPRYKKGEHGDGQASKAPKLAAKLQQAEAKEAFYKSIIKQYGKGYDSALDDAKASLKKLSEFVVAKEAKVSSKLQSVVGWKSDSLKKAKAFVKSTSAALKELEDAVKRLGEEADLGAMAARIAKSITKSITEQHQELMKLQKTVDSEAD